MKKRFYFIAGFLPVFAIRSHDGWGHTYGPVMALPMDPKPHLVAHELFHVRQFYFSLVPFLMVPLLAYVSLIAAQAALVGGLVAFLIFHLSPGVTFNREAAAYGESVRHGKDLHGAALALSTYPCAHARRLSDIKRAINIFRFNRHWI